jgi:hypothetical protein
VERVDDPDLARAVTLLQQSGDLTVTQLSEQLQLPATKICEWRDEGLLLPKPNFDGIHDDAWALLDSVVHDLPESEATPWRTAIASLQVICDRLGCQPSSFAPDQVKAAVLEGQAILNALFSRYHAPPLREDELVWTVDLLAPFRLAVAAKLKRRLDRTARQAWAFDRAGTGEVLAQDARRELARRTADSAWLGLAGYHVVPGSSPAHLPTASASVGNGEPGSWEFLGESIRDPDLAAELRQRFQHWIQGAGSDLRRRRINVSISTAMASGTGRTPGSALAMIKMRGDAFTIRLGSLTADPAFFSSRFHHLFAVHGHRSHHDWLKAWVRWVEESVGGLRLAQVVARGNRDRNLALQPPLTEVVLDPLGDARPSFAVDFDGQTRLRLKAKTDPRRIVPFMTSAAVLDRADPFSAWLQSASFLFGRPALLSPLPASTDELRLAQHAPRVALGDGAMLGPERWFIPREEIAALCHRDDFDSFLAWRGHCRTRRLPPFVYARFARDQTEMLLPTDSLLIWKVLMGSLRPEPSRLDLQETFATRDELWVRDENGQHYVSELAFAWAGDLDYWRGLA